MKRSIWIAALTVLFGAPVVAQEMQPAEPSSSPTEVQPTSSKPTVPVLVSDTRGQNDSDARECLQFSGNDQIHRCAEKYLPRVSRATTGTAKTDKPSEARKSRDGEKPAEATATAGSAGTPTLKSADSLGAAIIAKSGPTKP
jgi:hypothetical protein